MKTHQEGGRPKTNGFLRDFRELLLLTFDNNIIENANKELTNLYKQEQPDGNLAKCSLARFEKIIRK